MTQLLKYMYAYVTQVNNLYIYNYIYNILYIYIHQTKSNHMKSNHMNVLWAIKTHISVLISIDDTTITL